VDIFVKNVHPVCANYPSAAVAIMYRGTGGTPFNVTVKPVDLGLKFTGGYMTFDLFTGDSLGPVQADHPVQYRVNVNGENIRVALLDAPIIVRAIRRCSFDSLPTHGFGG
jgi:hypothetical protein